MLSLASWSSDRTKGMNETGYRLSMDTRLHRVGGYTGFLFGANGYMVAGKEKMTNSSFEDGASSMRDYKLVST